MPAEADGEEKEIAEKAGLQAEKPRIKIKVKKDNKVAEAKAAKGKKAKATKAGKRKRASSEPEERQNEDVGADGEVESTPIPRKKRAKKDHGASGSATATSAAARKSRAAKNGGAAAVATSDVVGDDDTTAGNHSNKKSKDAEIISFLDPSPWKQERDALDGSFGAAWKYFTKRGPWKLPAEVSTKFSDVALATLAKMDK